MAGSLENRGKLRELIDKFKFVELIKRKFVRLTIYKNNIKDISVKINQNIF